MNYFNETVRAIDGLLEADLTFLRERILELKERDGTLFLAGNGGSFAVAQHWALDLQVAGLKTHCLGTNTGLLTAAANDVGYESAFAIELRTHITSKDVLVCLSCSGTSKNIQSCLEVAARLHVPGVLITSRNCSGPSASVWNLIVPTKEYGVAEDVFSMIGHFLTEELSRE